MNEAFPSWYSLCVSNEHYSAKDLNHPFKLPLRSRGFSLYNIDPPLTQLAKHASKILGKALANETDIVWETVISAPELAAVQTASKIAFSATSDKTYVLIDESLCDPEHKKMDFMTPMELMKLDVAATVSLWSKSKESGENSVNRALSDIDRVQRSHKGNLIIVVGPSSFNTIVRQLLCVELKEQKESDIPQLACVILENEPRSWKLYKKQVLPLRNNDNTSTTFDPSFYLPK
ncbi:hypothetical protein DICVIV_07255 [Dictyocaulus viviparus]|uniref:Uncharacterized protein n=1 Tax=Dictyocaulus viviparus TaxID=29172 RepID=A0A0D8XWI4_DICVI|nr:hypothetical protein DICVIV_07255 [Dictyocaulus viviparus]